MLMKDILVEESGTEKVRVNRDLQERKIRFKPLFLSCQYSLVGVGEEEELVDGGEGDEKG